MTREEEIHSAIERRDFTTLRRMAEEVRTENTQMFLKLLAEMVDLDLKRRAGSGSS